MNTTKDTTSIIPQTAIDSYQRDGFFIAKQLFSAPEIAAIRNTFMDAVQRKEEFADFFDFNKGRGDPKDLWSIYPRAMNPHRDTSTAMGALAYDYLLDQRLFAYLQSFLEDEPLGAQTMFYYKPAGARGQDLHQDNFYLRVNPHTCIAAWIAIDDCDRENGGLKVVPGSHRFNIICPSQADLSRYTSNEHVDVPEGYHTVDAVMEAGDVLFFNGSVIHGSEPNTSENRFRRSLINHYMPRAATDIGDWYKPVYDFSGQPIEKNYANEGGPCGTIQDAINAAGAH